MENRITPSEAKSMTEVYGCYIKESVEDIYKPNMQDLGLVTKLAVQDNFWTKGNPKTQEGFNNRLKYIQGVFETYQEFRNILLKSGESPVECRDIATELLRRN